MDKIILFVIFAIIVFQVYRNIKLKFMLENRKVIVVFQIITYLILLIWLLTGRILLLILAFTIIVLIILITLIKPKN